jgi:hypothetical protein
MAREIVELGSSELAYAVTCRNTCSDVKRPHLVRGKLLTRSASQVFNPEFKANRVYSYNDNPGNPPDDISYT